MFKFLRQPSYLFAGILAIGTIIWVFTGSFVEARKDPEQQKAELSVQKDKKGQESDLKVQVIKSVAKKYTPHVLISGETQAILTTNIAAEVPGTLIKIYVKDGDSVKKGQKLAQISIDDRKAHVSEAQALVEQRRQQYSAAQRLRVKGYNSKTGLMTAKANYDAARAQLKQAQIQSARTLIRAPFSGVVGEKKVEIGAHLAIGQVLLKLYQLSTLKVTGQISEKVVGQVHVGDIAPVFVGENKKAVEGLIQSISPVSDPQTRTFKIEVKIDNKNNILRSGMTALMRVPLIPKQAHFLALSVLTQGPGGVLGVKYLDSKNRVHFKKTGIVADEKNGVWLSGLNSKVTIIGVGQNYVKVGQKVVPVPILPSLKAKVSQ